MSSRSYKLAIDHLNSLQSNAAALDLVRASGGRSSAFAIPEMVEYLGWIGYKPEDLNKLNVIHVTGTKGKGSTSAFTDSILRHVRPDWKIGLYTSPHLVAVRERLRINGAPISEESFAKFFFDVWDRIAAAEPRRKESTPPKPGYFRFLTLVAFHAFRSLNVDATILEVGVGGAHDSTNVVPNPVVTGITALGIDHVNVLGKTIPEIAWHKGGIFKKGVPAITVEQPEDGMRVLKERAKEKQASGFTIVPINEELHAIKLGLAGAHQIQNASLAIQLANSFLGSRSTSEIGPALSPETIRALESTKWPGRCQTVIDPVHGPRLTWFLDGAHTVESLRCCVRWFVSSRLREAPRGKVLIFNCTSGRSGEAFFEAMRDSAAEESSEFAADLFDDVVFCTNVTYASGSFKSDLTTLAIHEHDLVRLQTQRILATQWSSVHPAFPRDRIHVLPSIEHAVDTAQRLASDRPVDVLVTGSLHLVGGLIEVAGLADVAL